ncbi:MAG: RNA 2'-phosphotransferase [Verrucomicrobiota bacterium]
MSIRARQGHSVKVDVGLPQKAPPEFLFHGTAETSLPSIRRHGLLKRRRQHVHLSSDEQTARQVGSRHGKSVVLTKAGEMAVDGTPFFLSENGIWLVEAVPATVIVFPVGT